MSKRQSIVPTVIPTVLTLITLSGCNGNGEAKVIDRKPAPAVTEQLLNNNTPADPVTGGEGNAQPAAESQPADRFHASWRNRLGQGFNHESLKAAGNCFKGEKETAPVDNETRYRLETVTQKDGSVTVTAVATVIKKRVALAKPTLTLWMKAHGAKNTARLCGDQFISEMEEGGSIAMQTRYKVAEGFQLPAGVPAELEVGNSPDELNRFANALAATQSALADAKASNTRTALRPALNGASVEEDAAGTVAEDAPRISAEALSAYATAYAAADAHVATRKQYYRVAESPLKAAAQTTQ